MLSKVLKDMDFEMVLRTISKSINTKTGKKYLYSIKPLSDKERDFQKLAVNQLASLHKKGVMLPFYDFEGEEETIEKIRVLSDISPREFLGIFNLLKTYIKLYEVLYNTVIVEKLPKVEFIRPIVSSIRKKIGEDGRIKEDASFNLKKLTLKKRQIEEKLNKRLSLLLMEYYKKGVLREKFYTIKNHRFVFPFKQDASFSGVVHGYSHTDKTIYIEPYEIVDIQNELVKVEDERKEEEERIKRELIETLSENYETLKEIHVKMGWIDFLNALAIYKESKGGVFVESSESLYVKNLRHPVLLETKGYENVVPLNIERFDKKGLVISGPNAGGKTVVLKNIGILALSYMYALPVVADRAEIFPVKSIFTAGFTNEQDIERGRSTFSGIIEDMKEIIEKAEKDSIVLFDEPFSLTDPEEGEALAEGIIQYLLDKGVRVFITTHIWGLKFFAENHPEIENATMLFDTANGKPLYRFKIGVMGKSHAIEIAENIGLPAPILDYAKKRLSGGSDKVIDIIARLEKKESELIRKEKELNDREKEIIQREERLKKYGKKLIKSEYEKVERELKNLLKELHAETNLKKKVKKIQVVRKEINEKKKDLDDFGEPAKDLKTGKNYRIKPTGIVATLVEIRKKTAIVQIGKTKMEVPLTYLFEL